MWDNPHGDSEVIFKYGTAGIDNKQNIIDYYRDNELYYHYTTSIRQNLIMFVLQNILWYNYIQWVAENL